MFNMNPLFATDFYKPSHADQYASATEVIFSNFTPRSDRLFPHFSDDDHRIVAIGIQGTVKDFVIDFWNRNFFNQPKEKVIGEYVDMLKLSLNLSHVRTDHIEALHDLGYLPLEIRALPEGSLVPVQVPVYTIHNTDPRFFWLTNYFETAMSAETWKVMNNATIAYQYYKLCRSYAEETCATLDHLMFQCHDFSFRGLSGIADAYRNGFGHLASFYGTDTIAAIQYANDFYGMKGKFVAGSIPASEHSVATTNIGAIIAELEKDEDLKNGFSLDDKRYLAEVAFLRKYITEIYPSGFASYVADSYDYWSVVTDILPVLKSEIMSREGRLVIRPDSGDPVKVVAGYKIEEYANREAFFDGSRALSTEVAYIRNEDVYLRIEDGQYYEEYNEIPRHEAVGSIQILWEIFGGEVNSKGYKVLDSHIGLIYGDSITVERAREILKRLKDKGFASSNVVFGVGSYTYNYSTRDSLGFACKATGSVIGGQEILVTKEPKTDMKKKSAKGFLKVVNKAGNLELVDSLSLHEIEDEDNELQVVFRNGKLYNETTLDEIRGRLQK